jgi:O-antigen ligase
MKQEGGRGYVKRPGFWYRPLGIALTIAVIVLLWRLFPGNPTLLVLIGVAALFFFGFKKPVWAMAALLLSQLTITSYMVDTPFGWISLRLLLLIPFLFLMGYTARLKKTDWKYSSRNIITPVIILIAVGAIANLANSGFDFAFKDLRNMIVGLWIVLLVPAVVQNTSDLKTLCGVCFVVLTASAIIGLMQNYQFLGMHNVTLIPDFLSSSSEPRVPGMAETQLELAYFLSVVPLALFGVSLTKGISPGNRKLIFISLVLMILALYFTFTRSALYALVLGGVALFLFVRTRIRGEIILSLLLLALILIQTTGIMEGQYLGGRSESQQEESSIARRILWQAGMAIALDNPILGIGGDQYTSLAPQYESQVDSSLLEWEQEQYWGYNTLGREEIHNDFLNVWVSQGTVALIAYIWLYFGILRNYLRAYRGSSNRFIKGLSVGLAAALVAYGANAFYHNLMMTVPLLWVLAGFSVTTAKLAANEHRAVGA